MKLVEKENNPLFNLKKVSDLTAALEIKKGQLFYILYDMGVEKRYKQFTIPKKNGGERSIASPTKGLKLAQYKLFLLLRDNVLFKPCVKGFVLNEGVVKNAYEHKKSRWVLNVDIENFFGSINFGRVRGIFMAKPFEMSEEVANLIAKICILDNGLPQGSPTSPIIANIIASSLDNKILKLAKKYRLSYTRYADDITLSSYSFFPTSIAKLEDGETTLGDIFENVFLKSGFKVNYSKVRLQGAGARQEVTGLVVNKKVNIPVEFKKNIRSAIHQWCENPEQAGVDYLVNVLNESPSEVDPEKAAEKLKRNIYGRLSFMSQVKGEDDPTYIKLVLKMGMRDPEPPKFLQGIKERHHMWDVFICHASDDKEEIARPFEKELSSQGLSVFIDEKRIKWGDSLVDVINKALYNARIVVAVITDKSVGKSWPQREINAVLANEITGDSQLLVLVKGDAKKLLDANFLLKDKLYREWDYNAHELATEIREILAEK